jgi:hypothetical protein
MNFLRQAPNEQKDYYGLCIFRSYLPIGQEDYMVYVFLAAAFPLDKSIMMVYVCLGAGFPLDKRIGRVESLKNLILHGKSQPEVCIFSFSIVILFLKQNFSRIVIMNFVLRKLSIRFLVFTIMYSTCIGIGKFL